MFAVCRGRKEGARGEPYSSCFRIDVDHEFKSNY